MTTREEFEAWILAAPVFHATTVDSKPLEGEGDAYYWPQVEWAWHAWQASRSAALEEAAKECDLMAAHYEKDHSYKRADAAEQCAMGIRALKD